MFDVKAAEKKAREEIAEERIKAATKELKDKLRQIEQARAVVRNLEREYEFLMSEIGDRA